MSLVKITTVLFVLLTTLGQYSRANSLSERLERQKTEQNEKDLKRQKDLQILDEYEQLMANFFREGKQIRLSTPLSHRHGFGNWDVWAVRGKLFTFNVNSRTKMICNPMTGSLVTQPKLLATSETGTFEFDHKDHIYEINPDQNKCLYLKKGRNKVEQCRFIRIDRNDSQQRVKGRIEELRKSCRRGY